MRKSPIMLSLSKHWTEAMFLAALALNLAALAMAVAPDGLWIKVLGQ